MSSFSDAQVCFSCTQSSESLLPLELWVVLRFSGRLSITWLLCSGSRLFSIAFASHRHRDLRRANRLGAGHWVNGIGFLSLHWVLWPNRCCKWAICFLMAVLGDMQNMSTHDLKSGLSRLGGSQLLKNRLRLLQFDAPQLGAAFSNCLFDLFDCNNAWYCVCVQDEMNHLPTVSYVQHNPFELLGIINARRLLPDMFLKGDAASMLKKKISMSNYAQLKHSCVATTLCHALPLGRCATAAASCFGSEFNCVFFCHEKSSQCQKEKKSGVIQRQTWDSTADA